MSTAPLRQPAAKPDRIDPITTSVIQGALENIAVEMGYKLMRMSYSSIIRESEDFGAALVDAEGRGLAADHDGQRAVLGADRAAGDRGVQAVDAQCRQPLRMVARLARLDRRHVDERDRAQSLGGGPAERVGHGEPTCAED